MKAYGKSWNYDVNNCPYCLYWKGKEQGCANSNGCCCSTVKRPDRRMGADQFHNADKEKTIPVSECRDCPYGRASPCIGWCTKEVMRAVGILKERGSPYV